MSNDLKDRLQQVLGNAYTLDRELGGGGMSRVFVATETRLKRPVVVKVLSGERAAGVNAERFEREIQVAASLQQANIVPLLSTGETDGLPYYTMPYVEGESLRVRLAKGPLSITEIVRILGDVARALSYAHAHGIVHRDIKPDNVLISHGTAVVTDFGIAKAISAARTGADGVTLTQMGTSIGTPAYMAPEQAAGDPDVDHRADLYAFGCMAYELLSGRPPFHGRTAHRTLAAHMGEAPQPVSELRPDAPAPLAELVMRCLAKEVAERPQDAAELMRVLDTVTSGSGMQAMPPQLLGGPGMFRKALAIYAGAFIAVAILARAAVVGIGLPEWVFPGALIVMALGLPVVLWTGYVHRVLHRAATITPTVTPGGTVNVTQGALATMALKAAPHVSWRRTSRGGLIALGTFAVAVAAYMIMRVAGIGPFGSLLAAGALDQTKAIIVTQFRTTATDTSLGTTIAEGVRLQLSNSDAIVVLSPATIANRLRQMQLPSDSRVDLELGREMARRFPIQAIVDGEVAGVGTGYVVRLRLVRADSGQTLFADQKAAAGPTELIDAADALTRALRSRVGESLKRVNNAPGLVSATTSSLEALRWYTRGVLASDRNGNFSQAIEFHERAVAADSTFAQAWRTLGTMYSNTGAARSKVDTALARAYQFRERLSLNVQYQIAASYYSLGPGRDRVAAIAAGRARLANGGLGARNNLATRLFSRREYAEAESLLAWALRDTPGFYQGRANLVRALVQQGKLDAAESTVVAGFSAAPASSADWWGERAVVMYARGELNAAGTIVDSLVRDTTLTVDQRAGVGGFASALDALQGHVVRARGLLARTSAATRTGARARTPLEDSLAFARLDLILGNSAGAAVRVEGSVRAGYLEEGAPVDRPYLDVATVYALAGSPDRAREILQVRARELKDTAALREEAPAVHRVMGEIALAERKGLDAVREFWRSDSAPDGPSTPCLRCVYAAVARGYDAADQADSTIAYLTRYLDTPDFLAASSLEARSPDPLFRAPAHERLGQLYEAKGEIAKAAEQYRAFIDLWKDADPELQPRVAEARRRLARLTSGDRPR